MEMMLRSKGYTVVGRVSTAEEAINVCRNQLPDLVLMDIFIKGNMNGIEAVNTIRQFANPAIIYVTGNSDLFTQQQANETNPSGYLIKPVNANTLFHAVQKAFAEA